MRKKIVIGNWKMNYTATETKKFLEENVSLFENNDVDVVVCVPFTSLTNASLILKNTKIGLGAENFYYEDKGAFTGEISLPMLKDVGVKYVIVGHSERRDIFKEDDICINKKLKKALDDDFIPILCVGENLTIREKKEHLSFVEKQIRSAFNTISVNNPNNLIVAYEPIWAIGTGKTATSDEAEEMCAHIRNVLKNLYGDISENIRILYGGSVNDGNAKELFSKQNIDGGLVGGASLKPNFKTIIDSAV